MMHLPAASLGAREFDYLGGSMWGRAMILPAASLREAAVNYRGAL